MEPQTPAAQKNRRAHDKSPDYGLDGDITSSPWDWTTPFYAQLGESELATMLQWPTAGSCTRRETRPAVDGPTAKEHKETTETPISTVTFDVTQETSSPLGREDRVQTTRGSPIPESTRTRSSARVCRCQAETHVDALFQSTEQRGDDASNNAFEPSIIKCNCWWEEHFEARRTKNRARRTPSVSSGDTIPMDYPMDSEEAKVTAWDRTDKDE